MQFRKFLKLSGSVGMIGLLERAIQLATGVVLARWLGTEGYGAYAFAMAVVVLALLPVRFGLPDWLMREVAAGRGDPSREISLHRISHILRLVAGMGVIWALVGSGITLLLVERSDLILALLVALWLLPVTAMLDVIGATLRGWGKAVQAQVVTLLVVGVLTLISLLGVVRLWPDANTANVALALRVVIMTAAVIFGGLWLYQIGKNSLRGTPSGSPSPLWQTLRVGAPFMMISGAAVVLSRTDVLMLGAMSGTEAAGIYNVAAQGAMLVQLVLNIGNSINAPEYSRLHAKGDKSILEDFAVMSARSLAVIAVSVSLLLAIFSEAILTNIFGESFAGGASVLVILSLGFGLSFLFGETGFMLSMTGHEKLNLNIMGATAVFNVGANAVLIPFWGAEGAALSTVVSLILQRSAGWWTVRRVLGISCGCIRI